MIYTVQFEINSQLILKPGLNLKVKQNMEKINPIGLPCVQPLGEWMYSRILCLCQSVQDTADGFPHL